MKTYHNLQNIVYILAILLCGSVFSQAQQDFINYQGVAKDADNEAIAGQSVNIGVSLRFGSPTAAVAYAETHLVTTDANGVFSLQIGTGTVNTGIYKDLEWGILAPYASISLNGTDVGAVQLQSVPYANASGKATNMELNVLTNVSGTPTSGQVLKFDGLDWAPATDETGTGSSGLWKENENDIYYNDGNIGIGTNLPAVEIGAGKYLTISPSGPTTQNQFPSLELQGHSGSGNPTIGRIDFISNSSPGNSTIARIAARNANSTQFNGDIGFYTKSGLPYSASSLQERMTIKFDGKVGIGTTAPSAKFHIKTSDAQSARFESTGKKNYLEFFSNSQYQGYLGIFNGEHDMEFGTATGNIHGKVHLVTKNSPQLTVSANGNVGIGTTNPNAKLDVSGGQWDLNNTEGDLRIGNDTYRLKIGVSLDGGGAGRANIRAQGGINEISLGAGSKEVLRIKEHAIVVDGEINRPSTGNANLVPVAYGLVNGYTGNMNLFGTDNINSSRESKGNYLLIINGEGSGNYYTAVATRYNSVPGFIGITNLGSNIRVMTFDRHGDSEDCWFTFVAYKN